MTFATGSDIKSYPLKTFIFSWSTVRAMMSLPAVRLLGVFPFIGYIILFNDYALTYFQKLTGSEVSPTWALLNLYMLFAGLLLIGLSYILYSLLSPNEVRKFATYDEYCLEQMKTVTPMSMENHSRTIETSLADESIRKYISHQRDTTVSNRTLSPGLSDGDTVIKWSSWG